MCINMVNYIHSQLHTHTHTKQLTASLWPVWGSLVTVQLWDQPTFHTYSPMFPRGHAEISLHNVDMLYLPLPQTTALHPPLLSSPLLQLKIREAGLQQGRARRRGKLWSPIFLTQWQFFFVFFFPLPRGWDTSVVPRATPITSGALHMHRRWGRPLLIPKTMAEPSQGGNMNMNIYYQHNRKAAAWYGNRLLPYSCWIVQ